MSIQITTDSATAARHERFGHLPERIRPEDTVAEKAAAEPGVVSDRYNPENSWNYYSCLALDMGL
ncbi:hypothetical protein C6Y14_12320 [Streptomyces dioscori]|uniref:Uncharacterized protein n=1 Tax=Streptomyces dioscori TaxID=2109333 RepID=A0A2P8Q9N3_9ACTN|nr:hypothetical protein [Streptomyces dioscori]PSM42961.1 hypothetical protein C6Y14_12320 [Streptomyces dioscori]